MHNLTPSQTAVCPSRERKPSLTVFSHTQAIISSLHSVHSGKGTLALQYSPHILHTITTSKLRSAHSRKATQPHNIHLFLTTFTIPPHLVTVFCPQRERQPSHAAFSRHPHSSHCITKNAPYSWGNFHACAITRFQKPQQLGQARIACSSIITCAAEPDLSGQRRWKLRLKLLLVDQLAKKT